MHDCSPGHRTIQPQIPPVPGRSTSGFHRADIACTKREAPSGVRRVACRVNNTLPRTACEADFGTLCVLSCRGRGGGGSRIDPARARLGTSHPPNMRAVLNVVPEDLFQVHLLVRLEDFPRHRPLSSDACRRNTRSRVETNRGPMGWVRTERATARHINRRRCRKHQQQRQPAHALLLGPHTPCSGQIIRY